MPVSVNDTYGDPFIIEQVGNTVTKLTSLDRHRAPIAIFTKAGYSEEVLAQLETVPAQVAANVVVFYSLTGLDEGGISFDERVRFIQALREIFTNTLVFTRPIIRNRNDDPAMLRRLAEVAAEHTGYLVLGGLHDAKKRKTIETPVEDQLITFCDELGVPTFHKTSCAASWLHGTECWVHDLGAPRDLDSLVSLGYRFGIRDDMVVLDRGTTGDINFIRMLTRSEVYLREVISNYNLLTLPSGERKLEATSSWFAWSENIDTCLDCNYCIIKQIEYLKKMRVRIGVHPSRLPEIVASTGPSQDFSAFRLTKLPKDHAGRNVYADVRTVKPCRARLYPRPLRVERTTGQGATDASSSHR
ncbi:hypothetical protein ACQPZP_41620 [Spirillospora sp. CA-142024]|uniref:hypothetical protein n=1 Tax=Spirillospora sp. CA-142024 TaxID=3240036 RepID=UPI003D9236AD